MFAAALGVTSAHAATPARPDKIMTIAELRTCMKLEYSNKKAAEEILQEQETFKRDQAAVKAEQAEVSKTNDEIRSPDCRPNLQPLKRMKKKPPLKQNVWA